MAEGEFRHLITAIVVISLFAFSLIWMGVSMGNTYGKDTSAFDNSMINFTEMNKTIQNAKTNADNWQTIFTGQKKVLGIDGIILVGIFEIGKAIWNVSIMPFYLITALFQNILGIPPEFVGVIMFMIVVAFIFSLWRLIRVSDT